MSQLSPEHQTQLAQPNACLTLPELIAGAQVSMDSGEFRLDATIAQARLQRTPRGYVSPKLWDHGVTAGTLGYTFNANRNDGLGGGMTSSYLGLNAGFNLGSWYFRHNGSLSSWQGSQTHYQSINTYVQHDLSFIQSRLMAEQLNTSGELFDTLPLTGFQLASDSRMLPDSQRGYAPIVRGIADTNAHVTIRQNGLIL